MMDSNKTAITGVKKRQQISKANKAVFIWVTIAGVVLAVAVVLAQVMIKQFMFNVSIIDIQRNTNATLIKNAETYDPLRTEVSKLIANERLSALRTDKDEDGDNALQVVIDSMPTVDDRLSLAASLQQAVLSQSGVRIEQLGITDGATVLTTEPTETAGTETEGLKEVFFTFKAVGTYDQIKKMLDDMQLSIRPISVTELRLSGESSTMTAEIQAKSYYATPPTTDLKKETKKP